jgi:hypothetical protein
MAWSSETWSKASARATVGLDQIRTRFFYRIRLPDLTTNLTKIATGIWLCGALKGVAKSIRYTLYRQATREGTDPCHNNVVFVSGEYGESHLTSMIFMFYWVISKILPAVYRQNLLDKLAKQLIKDRDGKERRADY